MTPKQAAVCYYFARFATLIAAFCVYMEWISVKVFLVLAVPIFAVAIPPQFVFGRRWILSEKLVDRHKKTRRAKAALKTHRLQKSLLDRMKWLAVFRFRRQPLDRNDGSAIRLYREAISQRPNFAEALLNLGHALKSQGQADEARTCWKQALDVKPELAQGYFEQAAN